MDINDLSYRIIGCVYNVYNKLGPGLLESIYEKALMREFQKADIKLSINKRLMSNTMANHWVWIYGLILLLRIPSYLN